MATEAGITERERQVFALRYCEGLTDAVIAKQLGVTEETVRSTISHVTTAFREHQWATKHGARAAQENLDSLEQIEASEETTDYARGILEAHENRTSGAPGPPTRWRAVDPEDGPKGAAKAGRRQKRNEAIPPPSRPRMVTIDDVFLMILERENRA